MPLLDGAHHTLPAMVFTLAVAVVIAPFSYWQHGWAGVCVVALGVATIILSFGLAAWLVRTLPRVRQSTAGVLAATGLRIILPLALALVLVMGDSQLVPVGMVLYLVPLYLSMLCAETVLAARRPCGIGNQADAGQG